MPPQTAPDCDTLILTPSLPSELSESSSPFLPPVPRYLLAIAAQATLVLTSLWEIESVGVDASSVSSSTEEAYFGPVPLIERPLTLMRAFWPSSLC